MGEIGTIRAWLFGGGALGEGIPGEPPELAAASAAAPTLAQRILDGDPAAEAELVDTYRRGVLIIANARMRDREAARDVTQDVLIAVLQSLRQGNLHDHNKLPEYIRGVARNLINNYLGSRARRSECELVEESSKADPVEELETMERRRLVRSELANFPAIDQQILLLSLVDGHSLAEVAQRLNMSHEAVRARKSRAVRKITKKFMRASHR